VRGPGRLHGRLAKKCVTTKAKTKSLHTAGSPAGLIHCVLGCLVVYSVIVECNTNVCGIGGYVGGFAAKYHDVKPAFLDIATGCAVKSDMLL